MQLDAVRVDNSTMGTHLVEMELGAGPLSPDLELSPCSVPWPGTFHLTRLPDQTDQELGGGSE